MFKSTIYIGTYTRNGSEGIYCYEADNRTGELKKLGSMMADNPSYVAVSPDGDYVYACLEIGKFKGGHGGGIATYAVDGVGGFNLVSELPTGGVAPCHLHVTVDGRFLYCANYGEGTINELPLKDGMPTGTVNTYKHEGGGPDPARQKGPHAHFVSVTPDDTYLAAVDLGLDAVVLYPFDETKGISDSTGCLKSPVPGAGPRHLVFSNFGHCCYVLFEMGNIIASYAYSNGTFTHMNTLSTLPEGWSGVSSCAAVRISEDGRFVYASNRGHDSIAAFKVLPTGELELLGITPTGGKNPRDFNILPGGRMILVAHQDEGGITRLAVNTRSGKLRPAGQAADIPNPVSVCVER